MTKNELLKFRKWWNKNRSQLFIKIGIKDVSDFIELSHSSINSSVNDKFKVYPFENATRDQKSELVKGFVELTAKHTLQLFMSLGIKTHIETMIINDATGDEFVFSFKKVNK